MSHAPDEGATAAICKPKGIPPPPTADKQAAIFRQLKFDGPGMLRKVAADLSLQQYSDYLKSARWKRIAKRVMERDSKTCQSCGGGASEVYHRSYASAVLNGDGNSKLAAVCGGCYNRIHLTDEGVARDKADWDAVFLAG